MNIELVHIIREKIKESVPSHKLILQQGEGHVYSIPETAEEFVSVTTRLNVIHKPIFNDWKMNRALEYLYKHHYEIVEENKDTIFRQAKQYPEELFQQAGELGTKIHQIIDEYIKDWINAGTLECPYSIKDKLKDEQDMNVWSAVRSVEAWFEMTKYIPLASELRVWSPKHKIAGTLDGVGLIDDKMIILDFKTSNLLLDVYTLQVAAYWGMFKELTGYKPKKCIILHLDKDYGIPKTEEVKWSGMRFRQFMQVSRVYDVMQSIHKHRLTGNKKIIRL